ncbi:MAG TPA: cation-translocating P-type ATPase [Steroidobacteraceae bacterium]|nr:cation-translocating P-type ATPase [Steroidobacteraceae bacterium]
MAQARAAQVTSRQCAHCRLPLPAHPYQEIAAGETLSFCCVGCVLVYRVVGNAGEGGRADWFLAKLGLAALLSGNVMMFQSLSYFGTLESLGPEVLSTSSWIMFFCSLAIFGLLGIPMLRIALRGLAVGRLRLETLIGFGALAAIGFSAAQTLRGGQHLYYDSGTMVLVFVTLGQYLDAESRRRALALLSPTLGRARRLARLRRNNREVMLAPDAVLTGELVLVRAGEEIPVDGRVFEGTADVHEPLLTGEWRPRLVVAGDLVSAGSTAVDGALTVCASGLAETLAHRVERFAIEARDRRAPIEAIVDRVITVFIPAVMIIAICSFCLWAVAGNWERGFQAALAVLVVACPCALGIATPMATTIALSRAIGRGCLVRSGAVLETLSRVRAVAFDKTGTITTGRPRVGEFRAAPAAPVGPDDALTLAAGLEQQVSHPFARAIVESVLSRGVALPAATEVRVTSGAGAQGLVSGHRVAVGKLTWLVSSGVRWPPLSAAEAANSAVAIAIDGCLAGELVLDDPPRPEARAALAELERMRVSCHLVSGDRREVVARIAELVGFIDFASDQSPIDKPATVRALRSARGLIAMIGDGVNDAPALGAADAGIAFGPAADLARETADVTILREDLLEVPRLLELARKTFRVVRQNLAWAFAYNSVAVLIAAFGLLRPVFAAAAMVLSSVCVVANSMRLGGSASNHRDATPAMR